MERNQEDEMTTQVGQSVPDAAGEALFEEAKRAYNARLYEDAQRAFEKELEKECKPANVTSSPTEAGGRLALLSTVPKPDSDELNQERFEHLLEWIHSTRNPDRPYDRHAAGYVYEEVRK